MNKNTCRNSSFTFSQSCDFSGSWTTWADCSPWPQLRYSGGKCKCVCVLRGIWWVAMLVATHSETGGPARLPAQVAGRWGHINWNSVRWPVREKKYFVLGRMKVFCTGTTSPTNLNQGRTLAFVLFESPFIVYDEKKNIFESPFTSVSSVSRDHPSLVSLVGSAPVFHGKLSGFESKHPSKIKKWPRHKQWSGQHSTSPKTCIKVDVLLFCGSVNISFESGSADPRTIISNLDPGGQYYRARWDLAPDSDPTWTLLWPLKKKMLSNKLVNH